MKKSKLEEKFNLLWHSLNGVPLKEEFRFHHKRMWRLDFAHIQSKTAIEIQGGVWMAKGGHNTGKGISRDCEKGNEAKFLGWTVFHLTSEMITEEMVQRIINYIKGQKK